jgi:hypothetical protein
LLTTHLAARVQGTGPGPRKACPRKARGNAEQGCRVARQQSKTLVQRVGMYGRDAEQPSRRKGPAICPPGAFGGRGAPPWRGGPPAPAAMAAIIFCAIAFNPPPAGPGALPGPPPCPGGPLKGGPFLPPPLAPSRPARYSERNRAHNHTQKQIGKGTHGDKAASAPGTQKTPAEARALRALRPWSPHLSLSGVGCRV